MLRVRVASMALNLPARMPCEFVQSVLEVWPAAPVAVVDTPVRLDGDSSVDNVSDHRKVDRFRGIGCYTTTVPTYHARLSPTRDDVTRC